MTDRPSVAVVLPQRESFAPATAGAIALLARRLALAESAFAATVFGGACAAPFAGVDYQQVRPAVWPLSAGRRYAMGVGQILARAPPALIEVHNRVDAARYLARRLPVPVTLILHNDPQDMRGARRPAERAALLRTVARVATVSDHLRRRLLDGVADAPPVAVLPNCIDLGEVPPPVPREPVILFVGRVVADKGADAFVRACALALPRLPGWRADMLGADRAAGGPDPAFLAALRPEAVRANVALPGWRPHAEILAAMRRAAIVVVPSRWAEPFGLTALEAMACGAALLCSGRGGLAEVVGDAALTIDPDDPAGMADAIVALAIDAGRRVALGVAGRARAARFDVPEAAARLDALRRDVLAAWPRGARRPI